MTDVNLNKVERLASMELGGDEPSKNTALTEDRVRKEVVVAYGHYKPGKLDAGDEGAIDEVIRRLLVKFQTVIGKKRILQDNDEGWDPWLPNRRGTQEWPYWERYQELLNRDPNLSPHVIQGTEETTDDVLGLSGDPKKLDKPWDRRGLVVGEVQSGKTLNYIGLVNKGLDAGYKLIVVLTGFTENLRLQTQIRVDEGCVGFTAGKEKDEFYPVGVYEIDPSQRPNVLTATDHDFRLGRLPKGVDIYDNKAFLAVVKKNASVLNNLNKWIRKLAKSTDEEKGRRYVDGIPLLVIDDECDVGTIDTKAGGMLPEVTNLSRKPNTDHDPSRINERIRELLNLFQQRTYVGYSATPYANTFIHDQGYTEKLGDDLFPRNFIIALPTPSNHIGPGLVFGDHEDSSDSPWIESIPYPELTREAMRPTGARNSEIERMKEWMPWHPQKSHQPTIDGEDKVPSSLREAILTFMLVCAARRLRNKGTKHNSMLIHVTLLVEIQGRVAKQVDDELRKIRTRLRRRIDDASLREELRTLWQEKFQPRTEIIKQMDSQDVFQNPVHDWDEVEGQLIPAGEAIHVRAVNGKNQDRMVYEDHKKEGYSVIVIGGNKLSRGLTLDGLSVCYFMRASRMHDTLMQMGRWFGYRKGYLDLCRLFITDELDEWFGKMTGSNKEYLDELTHMQNLGMTPKQFGLRIRTHPGLLVTSRVKMQSGAEVDVSFEGTLNQTISFKTDRETVDANWDAARELMAAGNTASKTNRVTKEKKKRPELVGRIDVTADAIMEFLGSYRAHKGALRVDPEKFKEFIGLQAAKQHLINWTVHVSSGTGEENSELVGFGRRLVYRGWRVGKGLKRDSIEYKRKVEEARNNREFKTGASHSPPDESVDLTETQFDRALARTREDEGKNDIERPAGRCVRENRKESQGLLILYPLDPKRCKVYRDSDAVEEKYQKKPLVGFSISFPGDRDAPRVKYVVNNPWQRDNDAYLREMKAE